MKRPLLFAFAFGLAAILGLGWYLSRVNVPILEPAGPVALGERHVILLTLALCAIIVVPVFFLLFFFAYKYHDKNPAEHIIRDPDWDHDNLVAEFIWWLVPSIIIFFLAILAWQSSHALDPYKPLASEAPALQVEVVALDWKWLFLYPQLGIASVNMLEFPENVPVHFTLTADAPMNSFWIPQLGGQIMVMPGMTTQLNLMASRTGDFNGVSANISGEGFAGMTFIARAVSANDFESWVQSVRTASSSSLSFSTYQTLALPSGYNTPSTYASFDPNLYTEVINKYMTPGNAMSGMTEMQMNP